MSGVTGTSSGQWLGPSDSVGTTGSFGAMCDIVGLNSLASANSLGGASIGVDVDRDVSMGLTPSDGALPSPGTDVDPDFLSFLDLDLDNLLFFSGLPPYPAGASGAATGVAAAHRGYHRTGAPVTAAVVSGAGGAGAGSGWGGSGGVVSPLPHGYPTTALPHTHGSGVVPVQPAVLMPHNHAAHPRHVAPTPPVAPPAASPAACAPAVPARGGGGTTTRAPAEPAAPKATPSGVNDLERLDKAWDDSEATVQWKSGGPSEHPPKVGPDGTRDLWCPGCETYRPEYKYRDNKLKRGTTRAYRMRNFGHHYGAKLEVCRQTCQMRFRTAMRQAKRKGQDPLRHIFDSHIMHLLSDAVGMRPKTATASSKARSAATKRRAGADAGATPAPTATSPASKQPRRSRRTGGDGPQQDARPARVSPSTTPGTVSPAALGLSLPSQPFSFAPSNGMEGAAGGGGLGPSPSYGLPVVVRPGQPASISSTRTSGRSRDRVLRYNDSRDERGGSSTSESRRSRARVSRSRSGEAQRGSRSPASRGLVQPSSTEQAQLQAALLASLGQQAPKPQGMQLSEDDQLAMALAASRSQQEQQQRAVETPTSDEQAQLDAALVASLSQTSIGDKPKRRKSGSSARRSARLARTHAGSDDDSDMSLGGAPSRVHGTTSGGARAEGGSPSASPKHLMVQSTADYTHQRTSHASITASHSHPGPAGSRAKAAAAAAAAQAAADPLGGVAATLSNPMAVGARTRAQADPRALTFGTGFAGTQPGTVVPVRATNSDAPELPPLDVRVFAVLRGPDGEVVDRILLPPSFNKVGPAAVLPSGAYEIQVAPEVMDEPVAVYAGWLQAAPGVARASAAAKLQCQPLPALNAAAAPQQAKTGGALRPSSQVTWRSNQVVNSTLKHVTSRFSAAPHDQPARFATAPLTSDRTHSLVVCAAPWSAIEAVERNSQLADHVHVFNIVCFDGNDDAPATHANSDAAKASAGEGERGAEDNDASDGYDSDEDGEWEAVPESELPASIRGKGEVATASEAQPVPTPMQQ